MHCLYNVLLIQQTVLLDFEIWLSQIFPFEDMKTKLGFIRDLSYQANKCDMDV